MVAHNNATALGNLAVTQTRAALPSTPVTTPTATPVSIKTVGEGIYSGNITVGGGERWTLNGIAGDHLDIHVFAETPANEASMGQSFAVDKLDTYVILRGPNNTILAESDDILVGIHTDSRIDISLPTTGGYTIEVRSANNLGGGKYRLVLKTDRSF